MCFFRRHTRSRKSTYFSMPKQRVYRIWSVPRTAWRKMHEGTGRQKNPPNGYPLGGSILYLRGNATKSAHMASLRFKWIIPRDNGWGGLKRRFCLFYGISKLFQICRKKYTDRELLPMRITATAPKAACRCFLLIYMPQKKQRKPDMQRRFRTKSLYS